MMRFNMLGDTNEAGPVRLSDVYNSSVGGAAAGIAASQKALYDVYSTMSAKIINEIYPVGSLYQISSCTYSI